MKKFLLIVLLFLLPLMVANAQDLEKLRRNLDAPLQGLDFSKIPTGILAERAMELLPFDAYDGVLRDSNYSDYASQAMLYLSLASSGKEVVEFLVCFLVGVFFVYLSQYDILIDKKEHYA
ncbi:hypothetical protein [Porphyromonas endodontalis]|uniref:hypothetical protein n=1 Tax=Porphyromonas endodontalis TaxID=28124 RepID=UPI003C7C8834